MAKAGRKNSVNGDRREFGDRSNSTLHVTHSTRETLRKAADKRGMKMLPFAELVLKAGLRVIAAERLEGHQ